MAGKQKTVRVDPLPIRKKSRVIVHYQGDLPLEKGTAVYVHYGFGTNGNWEGVDRAVMVPSPHGYTAAFNIPEAARLNLCFHDDQGHWDNNSGNNWSFEIQI